MSYYFLLGLSALICSVVFTAAGFAAAIEGGADPSRVSEIAAMLGEKPFAFGPGISDRAAWEKLAQHEAFKGLPEAAERKLAEPMPQMTEEIYSSYAKTGQRTKLYADTRGGRTYRLVLYTLAECIENKGRFIPELEKTIDSICAEPTWILNAHDTGDLADWKGKRLSVDLGSSALSGDLAQTLVVMEDRLSPKTRQLVRDNCRRRTLEPYLQAVQNGGASGMWWISSDMNWNSVCHNGVLATALAIADDRQERALFIACAEKFSHNYLRGFGPDGYCSEGMGYWNYGFSNYVQLAELIYQATAGRVDLYALPGAREAASYPTMAEIRQQIYPSFADCGTDSRPDSRLSSFLSRHYRLPLTRATVQDLTDRSGGICSTLMYSCLRPEIAATPSATSPSLSMRSFFQHGGVLTCRPAEGSAARMSVSLKGGNNAEFHNHNDLGSYVVVIGEEQLILDPGGEVYTSRTFSKDRYKSNLLNSFGHPVPVIAGQLQREGKEAVAKALATDFTDSRDTYMLDLSSAYAVPQLEQLTRQFVYDRTGECSLTVVDEVRFSTAQSFATAILTYKKVEVQPDSSLLISGDSSAVLVEIDAGGVPFDIAQQVIEEQTHSGAKPTRIGINLREPIKQGTVKLTITPVAN